MKALVDHPAFNMAIFALLLSLPWEFGQMWLYAGASGMSHLLGIRICMAATMGDAVIMLVAFAIIAAFARSQDWVRALGQPQAATDALNDPDIMALIAAIQAKGQHRLPELPEAR